MKISNPFEAIQPLDEDEYPELSNEKGSQEIEKKLKKPRIKCARATRTVSGRPKKLSRKLGRKQTSEGSTSEEGEKSPRENCNEEIAESDCETVKPQNPWIAGVDSCVRNDLANLMEMSRTTQDWERIAMKKDSGAVDTVRPPTVARHFPTEETARSKTGA